MPALRAGCNDVINLNWARRRAESWRGAVRQPEEREGRPRARGAGGRRGGRRNWRAGQGTENRRTARRPEKLESRPGNGEPEDGEAAGETREVGQGTEAGGRRGGRRNSRGRPGNEDAGTARGPEGRRGCGERQ